MQEMELFETFVSEYADEFASWGCEPYGISGREFEIGIPFFSSGDLGWGTLKRGFVVDSNKPLMGFVAIGEILFNCLEEFEDAARRNSWADAIFDDLVVCEEPFRYPDGVSLHWDLIEEGYGEEEVSDFYGSFRDSERGREIRQMIDYAIDNAHANVPDLINCYHNCRDDFFRRNRLAFDIYGNVVIVDE